ncbi:MAG: hypothetical protein MHM6MM_001066 [Cercozoa sp. M6MM]
MVYDGNNDIQGLCNNTDTDNLRKLFRLAMEERNVLSPPSRDFVKFTFRDKEIAEQAALQLYGPDPAKKQQTRSEIIKVHNIQ